MDSHQPAMLIQNQDGKLSRESKEGGDGVEVKHFEKELHPLQIGAVLEQVFSNLSVYWIKIAREVHPKWSIEGAKILIAKCYIIVPSDIHDGDFISKFKAMDEFKAFLSLKSIAISTISKIKVDRVADVEVWKYLGVLEQVKSLKISNIPSKNQDEFFKNLLDLLPNLDYLRFDELDEESKLIRALTSVMSAPEKGHNCLVISSLYLNLEKMEQLADIEKFASCKNIMIETLCIRMVPDFLKNVQERLARVARTMSTLLSTSQNILTTLNLKDCHLVLPLLEFPCMIELASINFEFEFAPEDQRLLCKFSPSFRFSEKVPKLQNVTIKEPMSKDPLIFGQSVRHCCTNLFKNAGTAPLVTRASCWGNVSNSDIYYIFKTFPNIEIFWIDVKWHSHAMLRALWKHGRNLKALRLDFDLNPPLKNVDDLDVSFTGLALWTVDEIKKAPNLDSFTVEELEELRIDSSIMNLKELEHLTILFSGSWKKDWPERLLVVAGEYAFKLMSKNPDIIINIEEFQDSMDFTEVSKLPNVEIVS